MNSTKKIKAMFILEIIGRPKEHLVKTLKELIEKIDSEKGVKVLEKEVKDPIEMKNQEKIQEDKKFYTTFGEVEIEVETISQLMGLMFKYMPANIEIIEPESMNILNNELSDVMSELIRRLHGYDEIARVLQMQNAQAQKKIKELLEKENKKE